MCLLTLAPEGVEHDEDALFAACVNNPDGFGYAIHAGRHIIRRRSMSAYELIDRYMIERKANLDGAAIFHARIATSGKVDNSGCHPFYLPGNKKVALAHNGVLPIQQDTGWRSDTRHLTEVVIPSHGGIGALRDQDYLSDLAKWMGPNNKVAILSADRRLPAWQILNESSGHWEEGSWWSNYSYYIWQKKSTSIVSYTGGTTSYRKTTFTPTETEDDQFFDRDLPEDWPCPTCGNPVGMTALEDGRCQFCWADLDAHTDSVWCTCDRCLTESNAELASWLSGDGPMPGS